MSKGEIMNSKSRIIMKILSIFESGLFIKILSVFITGLWIAGLLMALQTLVH